ncbi:hypothetical protein AB0C12_16115 [Actinoplanes sp. NPDC048967]|uniref:hypothetical protein n=1 Tax=Actinoplanes sp. NPDC048967 TaxID=3155269 RepID=UPI0033DF6040
MSPPVAVPPLLPGPAAVDRQQLINVLALLVALAAVLTSTFLARLTLRLNHNANLMRIVLEALEKQRRGTFTATEIALLEELPKHDVDLGFARLPAPVLEDAFEVACYYQHLSTLAEYGAPRSVFTIGGEAAGYGYA